MQQALPLPLRVVLASLALAATALHTYLVVRALPPGRRRLAAALPVLAVHLWVPLLFDLDSEPLVLCAFSFLSFRMPATKASARGVQYMVPCRVVTCFAACPDVLHRGSNGVTSGFAAPAAIM